MKAFLLLLTILATFSLHSQTGMKTPTKYVDTTLYIWKGKSKDNRRNGEWQGTHKTWKSTIEANYTNGTLNGKWTAYFSSDKVEEEGTYVNGLRDGKWLVYNGWGDTDMCCHYKNGVLDGEYLTFNYRGMGTRHGVFVQGKKNGSWTEKVYAPNYEPLATIVYQYNMDTLNGTVVEQCYRYTKTTMYENGIEMKRDSVATTNEQYDNGEWPPNPDPVLLFAEEMPQFVGGEGSFQQYLIENVRYPKRARDNKKQGTVYIYFVVEKDGSVTNVYCVKGVPDAPELEEEAMQVFRSMPNWEPGKMKGKPVRVSMTSPVKFVLD